MDKKIFPKICISLFVLINFTFADQVVLGTESGAYLSSNSGQSWTYLSLNNSLINKNIAQVYVDSQKLIVATSQEGIFISLDQGLTWKPVYSARPKTPHFLIASILLFISMVF